MTTEAPKLNYGIHWKKKNRITFTLNGVFQLYILSFAWHTFFYVKFDTEDPLRLRPHFEIDKTSKRCALCLFYSIPFETRASFRNREDLLEMCFVSVKLKIFELLAHLGLINSSELETLLGPIGTFWHWRPFKTRGQFWNRENRIRGFFECVLSYQGYFQEPGRSDLNIDYFKTENVFFFPFPFLTENLFEVETLLGLENLLAQKIL